MSLFEARDVITKVRDDFDPRVVDAFLDAFASRRTRSSRGRRLTGEADHAVSPPKHALLDRSDAVTIRLLRQVRTRAPTATWQASRRGTIGARTHAIAMRSFAGYARRV